jgi:hypothetical protein
MQRAEIAAIMNQLPAWKQKRVRFVFSGAEGGPKTSLLIVDDVCPYGRAREFGRIAF